MEANEKPVTTKTEAILAIRRLESYKQEYIQYEAAAQKLNELSSELRLKSRNYPPGMMKALGFEAGQVVMNHEGRIGVILSFWYKDCNALVGLLTKRGLVSSADGFISIITPTSYNEWTHLGHTIEPKDGKYQSVLVPVHKRVKVNPDRLIKLS